MGECCRAMSKGNEGGRSHRVTRVWLRTPFSSGVYIVTDTHTFFYPTGLPVGPPKFCLLEMSFEVLRRFLKNYGLLDSTS